MIAVASSQFLAYTHYSSPDGIPGIGSGLCIHADVPGGFGIWFIGIPGGFGIPCCIGVPGCTCGFSVPGNGCLSIFLIQFFSKILKGDQI